MNVSQRALPTIGESFRWPTTEQRLKELGINIPLSPEPFGTYKEAVQTGNLLFLSGILPTENRGAKFIGRLGAELDINTTREAAKLATLNALAVARQHLIPQQSNSHRPPRRVRSHFRRCTRSAESGGRCFGVAARHLWQGQETPADWFLASQVFRLARRSNWKSYSR